MKAFLLGSVLALIAVAAATYRPATEPVDYLPDVAPPVRDALRGESESSAVISNDVRRLIAKA